MNLRPILAIAVALTACDKASEPAGPPPSVDAVLEAELEATGGRATWSTIKTLRVRGTVTFAAAGIEGPFSIVAAAPNNTRLHMEIVGAGTFDSGRVDNVSWERSDAKGARLKTGDELARDLRTQSIQTLDWHAEYDTIEMKGPATFADRPAWKLVFTQPGAIKTKYYDRSTHLFLGEESTEVEQDGTDTGKMVVRDYRSFGPVKQPAVLEMSGGGNKMRMTMDDVEINPTLPADAFALPPDVAALPR